MISIIVNACLKLLKSILAISVKQYFAILLLLLLLLLLLFFFFQ